MIRIYGEKTTRHPPSPILNPHLCSDERKYLEHRDKKPKDFNHLTVRRQPLTFG